MSVNNIGRPTKYTPESLEAKFRDYIDYCLENGRLANIDGFSIYAEIDDQTYYNYKVNPDFLGCIKNIEKLLLDETMQKGLQAKNPAFIIFYLKNKFNWADKQEITQNGETTVNHNLDLGGYSLEDLKDILNK